MYACKYVCMCVLNVLMYRNHSKYLQTFRISLMILSATLRESENILAT